MPADVMWHCIVESADSRQPSALYISRSEPTRYRSKPIASHKMKTIQNLLIVATVALLFLVGRYAATYTGLACKL